MARERVVSRTVSTRICTVMCADLSSNSVKQIELEISATIPENQLVKALQKQYNTNTLMVLNVVSSTVQEQIYAMPEEQFIKLAKKMTADRKFIAETEDK